MDVPILSTQASHLSLARIQGRAARTRVSRRRGGEDIRVNFSCCHRELIASRFELINFMELIGESMRIGKQPAELA